MKQEILNLICGAILVGVCLFFTIIFTIHQNDIQTNWVQVQGSVDDYSVWLTDTGMDWVVHWNETVYIPSEYRFVKGYGENVPGVSCPNIHWWIFDYDCFRDNSPMFKIGEKVLVKYNPKDPTDVVVERP